MPSSTKHIRSKKCDRSYKEHLSIEISLSESREKGKCISDVFVCISVSLLLVIRLLSIFRLTTPSKVTPPRRSRATKSNPIKTLAARSDVQSTEEKASTKLPDNVAHLATPGNRGTNAPKVVGSFIAKGPAKSKELVDELKAKRLSAKV